MALGTLRQVVFPPRPPSTPELRRRQRFLIWVVLALIGVLIAGGVAVGVAKNDFMWGLWGTMLTAMGVLVLTLLVGSIRALADTRRARG